MLLDYLPLFSKTSQGQGGTSSFIEPLPTLQIVRGRALGVLVISSSVTASKQATGGGISAAIFASTVAGKRDISEARRRDELILAL